MPIAKVAILGASGFIGSRLVETLLLKGAVEPVAIVPRFSSLARLSRFEMDWRIADAMDSNGLGQAFQGCEVVIHSVRGPLNMVAAAPGPAYEAAEAAGVKRIIYLSTAVVHGQDPEAGTTEATPLNDRQPVPYNNAKVVAEKRFFELRRKGGVELVVLRPAIVFGPRDKWTRAIAESVATGKPYLINGGQGICNTTYVDNLVHAINLAMTADVDGEAFFITDKEEITWHELYQSIARALNPQAPILSIDNPIIKSVETSLIDLIKGIPPVLGLLPYVPKDWKKRCRDILEQLTNIRKDIAAGKKSRHDSLWSLPVCGPDAVSLELSQLHQCRYKLSSDKAARMMGYEPIVTVDDGIRRSLGWLDFVGYPVKLPKPAAMSSDPPSAPGSID